MTGKHVLTLAVRASKKTTWTKTKCLGQTLEKYLSSSNRTFLQVPRLEQITGAA
ncbi:MAG: hypothetical protein ACPGLY_07530 [Rubripirellula sp.]